MFAKRNPVGCRNRAIILVFLDSGIRLSELAGLDVADVDMETGALLIKHGKDRKQRVARIGSVTLKALWRYITVYRKGKSNRLFLTKTGQPLGIPAIRILIKRLGKKAGVPDIHVHRLRHTFAISFLRAGGDIFTLKYLLGHSSLTMVENCLKSLNAEDAARAHQRFSPVNNLKLK